MKWPKRPKFDAERYWTLQRIAHVERHGVLDGVEIDLRHPDLDPKEWKTYPLGLEDSRYRKAPFIWFPGLGEPLTQEEMEEGFAPDEIRRGSRGWRMYKMSVTPDAIVYSGDKIIIDRVIVYTQGNPFKHQHDQEVRCAYLKIIRANGKTNRLKEPLQFFGRTSFQLGGTGGQEVLPKISDRILSHFGVASISDPAVETLIDNVDGDYAKAALFWLKIVEWRNKDVFQKERTLDLSDPEWRAASDVKRNIEHALLIGYYWAMAETKLMMQPLAISGLEVQRAARKAGKTSGESRRAKAERTWKAHALDLAVKLRTERPELSQHRLADEIGFAWKLDGEPPGHTSLTGYISELEKSGALPARKK